MKGRCNFEEFGVDGGIGFLKWLNVSQDRVHWRDLVNAVSKVHVL
jgi:hypothetical protein